MAGLIDDPDLLSEILREFKVKGAIDPFQISQIALPVFDIGSLSGATPTVVTTTAGGSGVRIGTLNSVTSIVVSPQVLANTNVTDSGPVVNPAAAQVIADSGQLTAAENLVHLTTNNNAAISDFQLEWRNAANTATITQWTFQVGTGQPNVQFGPMALFMASNERLRLVSGSAVVGTVAATITAQPFFVSTAS